MPFRRLESATSGEAMKASICRTASTCVDSALPKACDDATSTSFCTPLVTSCKANSGNEITQAACESVAKALTTAGRDQFTSCVTEGTAGFCTADSSWCIDAIKW